MFGGGSSLRRVTKVELADEDLDLGSRAEITS
jgi:hypothetical protein